MISGIAPAAPSVWSASRQARPRHGPKGCSGARGTALFARPLRQRTVGSQRRSEVKAGLQSKHVCSQQTARAVSRGPSCSSTCNRVAQPGRGGKREIPGGPVHHGRNGTRTKRGRIADCSRFRICSHDILRFDCFEGRDVVIGGNDPSAPGEKTRVTSKGWRQGVGAAGARVWKEEGTNQARIGNRAVFIL